MIERHKKILEIMTGDRKASVNAISLQLKVTPATIRQDLTILEEKGFLKRVHGGAVLNDTDDISHRMGVNYEEKLKIAKTAAELVNEGETIFIESGSINALFAKEVSVKSGVTIITSNAFIARWIGKKSSANVILLGGLYQAESESLVGNLIKIQLEQLNFSKAFIGIDGFTPESGFTGRDLMRADINNYIVKKSPETYIISDSSKFGKIALSYYFNYSDVNGIITDKNLKDEYKSYFNNLNVQIIFAK